MALATSAMAGKNSPPPLVPSAFTPPLYSPSLAILIAPLEQQGSGVIRGEQPAAAEVLRDSHAADEMGYSSPTSLRLGNRRRMERRT
jgi:hypothetical protein